MEHRCGTFFSGIYVYASRISIADRGAAEAAAQQQQHSSSSTAAVVAATSSCCLGPSTPGQTRTPNEENGTPKRDFFSGLCILQVCIACGSALRIVPRDASRIVEQQKQQHSSSSTAAVVAATSRLRTKRTSVDAPVSLLFSFLRFRAI